MSDIKLTYKPVELTDNDILVLYNLLKERTPEQSISHRGMPTFKEHSYFVRSKPYMRWYFIIARTEHLDVKIGAIYLTYAREIGVSIFKTNHKCGFATHAIEWLMKTDPGEFLANINPSNEASIALFKKFGFELIQHTYRLDKK